MKEYKNEKQFEEDLQEMDGCPDNVMINDVVFTMDEYDSDGKEISFGNKRTETGFIIHTNDRYKDGFGDAVVDKIEDSCLRNDIVYLD